METNETVNTIQTFFITYGIRIVAAIAIFIIGRWIAKIISNLIEKVMLKGKVDATLAGFSKNIVNAGIMVFVCIAALNKIGVETTSLIAVIGAAGLAVGLALQGSLANFAAGIMIIIFKPFKVSDLIEAAGELGVVKEIHIFHTIMYTLDNRRVIVPNSGITGGNIINFTGVDKRRVDLVFGISYEDNMKTAKEALMKVITSNPLVLKDPAPMVAVKELGDSSVNLVCRPWCKPADYWTVYFETVEQGKEELEKAGITIPFPQRDVHIYQEDK